jgi:hypothetical protein
MIRLLAMAMMAPVVLFIWWLKTTNDIFWWMVHEGQDAWDEFFWKLRKSQ